MTPSCRVCGAELIGELVSCERCQTPHHRDCWEYWGRCATYGCTGLVPPERNLPVRPDETAVLEVRPDSDRPRYLPRRPLVESHHALLFSPEGAHVRLSEGEVALQLPPDLALELPLPQYTTVFGHLLLGVCTAGVYAIGLLRHTYAPDLLTWLMTTFSWPLWFIGALRLSAWSRARRARRMWLVQQENGQLTVEAQVPGRLGWLDGVRVRFRLVLPFTGGAVLRARGVCLRPAYGGGLEQSVVKAYRLQLECELPDEGVDVISPLAVPGKGEPRHDFLQELSRIRGLGKQIAGLYRVPYVEANA